MKRTVLARTLLGLAVLMLVGVTALAQDNKLNNVITINGGRTTVAMRPSELVVNHAIKSPASPFYNSVGSGYDSGVGWTISDGSPENEELTPANQIISLRSGTTKKISVGAGFEEGTNEATVYLDKDCKNVPCGKIYKTNLCKGNVKNLPNFGSTSTTLVSIKCKAKLVKGKPYWVYVAASKDNSLLAWNLNATGATGGFVEGTNGVWGSYESNDAVGALEIK